MQRDYKLLATLSERSDFLIQKSDSE